MPYIGSIPIFLGSGIDIVNQNTSAHLIPIEFVSCGFGFALITLLTKSNHHRQKIH